MQRRTALTICIGIVVITAVLAYYNATKAPFVVELTDSGFRPTKFLVRKGQSVTFVNASSRDMWPASDSHPTHTRYPEFDPQNPIAPRESWTFTFTKAGVWTYHDHLSSDMRGTIIVVGAPGEATAECLSNTASTSVKAICWEGDITDALESKGLDAAFELFASLYKKDPRFRGLNCHDSGHVLGSAAYRAYANNHAVIDRLETSYCGYGFYHGFMEAMLLDQGPSQYEKVREYCEALKTTKHLNNPSGACYHGIGHAAFDSLPSTLWGDGEKMTGGAIGECEKAVLGEAERAQCSTGVYNALANAESARSYKLSFDYPDPMRVCRTQKKEYQNGCYGEVGIGVIRDTHLDRPASLHFIESFPYEDAVAKALLGYAADEVKRSISAIDLFDLHQMCASFASEKNRNACRNGIISGMREAGNPGKEYELMFRYCDLYDRGPEYTACYSLAISQTRAIAADPDDFSKACTAVDDASVRALCK